MLIGFVLSASAASKPAPPYQPTDDEKQQIRAKAGELASALKQLAAKTVISVRCFQTMEMKGMMTIEEEET